VIIIGAQYDGSIRINTKIDSKGYTRGVNTIKSSLGGLARAVGIAFSVKQLISFGSTAIQVASDVQEVQNVVDTAFGSMAHKMEAFADVAVESFGISKLTAKQTGSTFMAMASGMNLASDYASDLAIQLTGLSADMASFYNVEQAVASTALKSIFTGETETLKQFGVVMTEVNLQEYALSKGISKAISKMSQQEKVMLRAEYVTKQLSLASGDFAKTQDSWANQTRILTERWKEFKSVIGTGLITALTPALQFLNNFLQTLIDVANAIGEVMAELFGLKAQKFSSKPITEATGQMSDGLEGVTSSANEAEKAMKNVQAAFDDVDVLEQEDTAVGNSGGGGYFDSTDIEADDYQNVWDEAFDNVESRAETFAKRMKDYLEPLAEAFKDYKAGEISFGELSAKVLSFTIIGLEEAIINGLDTVDWFAVGQNIYDFITNIEWENIFSETIDLGVATFKIIPEIIIGFASNPIFETFASIFGFETDDFWKFIKQETTGKGFEGEVNFDLVMPLVLDYVKEEWDTKGEEINQWMEENVFSLFSIGSWIERAQNIGIGIGIAWGNMIGTWKKNISEWWNNDVSPWFTIEKWKKIGTDMADGIGTGFDSIVQTVKDTINRVLEKIEAGINNAIDFVNVLIAGYNKIAEFSSNLNPIQTIEPASLPRLAQGAVFQGGSPYMAIVNDQPAGQTNIETPLATMIEAFQTAMADMKGASGGMVEIVLDGKVLGTATLPYLQGETNRIGTTFKLI